MHNKLDGEKTVLLARKCIKYNVDIYRLLRLFQRVNIEDLTEGEYESIIGHWKEILGKCEAGNEIHRTH